jgi:transposase InsO family protein
MLGTAPGFYAMYMAYSTNPHLPRLRMDAVKLVRTGWSIRRVARHFGFHHTAVMRWVRRAAQNSRVRILPTHSSRPHHHPHELSNTLVQMILCYREHYQRDAFFIHHLLTRDGVTVSLSSVKRTLRRYHLTYPSKWKKWHYSVPRPLPAKPGFLVEIDTIHDGGHEDRLYIYTLLDVCSRWAYATPVARINTHGSLRFVETARHHSPFLFATLQSDHGSEFSKWFTTQIEARGLRHRHSRVRQPNDNAHLERWNRTLQQECLSRVSRSLSSWQRAIPEYLRYYNEERPHMGLLMKTPIEVVRSY